MRSVERLQTAPWLDGTDADPNGEAARSRRAGDAVPGLAAVHRVRRAGARRRRARSPSSTTTRTAPTRRGSCTPTARGRATSGRSRWRPASCSAAWPGTSTTSRTATSSIRGCPAPRCERPRLRMQDRSGEPRRQRRDPVHELQGQAQRPRGPGQDRGAEPARAAGDATRTCAPSTPTPARSSPRCWWSAPPISGSHRRCRRWRCRRRGRASWRRRSRSTGSRSRGSRATCSRSPAVPCPLCCTSARGPTTSCGPRWRHTGRRWPARATRARGRRATPTCGPRSGRSSPPPAIRTPRRTSPCTGRASLPRYRTSSTTSCRPSGCARPARSSGSPVSTPPTPRTPTSSRSPR